jgi:hypothetical protein
MIPVLSPLSAAALLAVWEQGQGAAPARRALLLLAAATRQPLADLAVLSVGERDAALLTLRERCFGTRLESIAGCPACAAQLELAFHVADIRVAQPDAPREVWAAGRRLAFRLPTAGDLLALAEGGAPATSALLLQRCVPDADPHIVAEAEAALAEALAAADPQADVRLALTCPACGHAWRAPFDIATFFWAEIEAWALRMLRDIHTLAQAYGWSEAAILDLSPLRRQQYLELVGQFNRN